MTLGPTQLANTPEEHAQPDDQTSVDLFLRRAIACVELLYQMTSPDTEREQWVERQTLTRMRDAGASDDDILEHLRRCVLHLFGDFNL